MTASSATERHSQEGTVSSSTRFRAAGTPALRKYFCARISEATWLQLAGTSMSSRRKTTDPSGFLISLTAFRKSRSVIGVLTWFCVAALDLHGFPSFLF